MNGSSVANPVQGWIGIDVAKRTFDAAVWWPDPQPENPRAFLGAPVQTFARTPQGCRQLVAWAEPLIAAGAGRVVMEATGRYSLELTAWLLELRPAWAPAIVQPKLAHDFIDSLGLRNRTDRLAARGLAYYGVERRPAPYQAPQPEYAQLRELVRFRRQLVEDQTLQRNQASESVQTRLVRQVQSRRLKQGERDIARIEAAIRAFIGQHPALQRDFSLLTSVVGIGFVVAVTLLGELGDLRRFATGRQLAAFTGLNPCNVDSGESVHSKPHLFKGGNRPTRHVLYLAAMAIVNTRNDLQQFYLRVLKKHPDTPLVALVALMRKLLLVARAVVVAGVPFQPRYRSARITSPQPVTIA